MMRLSTYAGASFVGAMAIIYHAFNSRGQFYPAMVYLSTSKISLVLLLNMGLVIMCILWQCIKRLFLGSLREAEVERLNEQSWREIMEILFAITIFREEFSVAFLSMVTALLLIKAFHWLAQKRVEYIETTPTVTVLSHIRIVSFLGFLLLLDCIFLYSSVSYLLRTRRASVALFFSFEYMILATTTVSTFLKYVFYVSDMLMEGQWERKAVYTFYLELIRDLLHLSMYLFFFLAIFINYGLPLHLIRELYETFRNFKARVADYIRYRKITSNMNDRFPDATPEELNASDATCIICREEMVTAKKLICGHLFHVHCLRSWLERQQTCPTCRSYVLPPENGTSSSGGHQVAQPHRHQHGGAGGSGTAEASAQNTGGGVAEDNVSLHQARLRAAAAAANVYGGSYVYPSANAFVWSPGYALVPKVFLQGAMGRESTSEEATDSSGENAQTTPSAHLSGNSNFTFPQGPQYTFLPLKMPLTNGASDEGSSRDPTMPSSSSCLLAQFEAQEKFLRYNIEVLQNQLKTLQNQKPIDSKAAKEEASSGVTESKGKGPAHCASPRASSSDCRHHPEIQEAQTD
ncbi:hypothetical protein AMTRI_Chr06g201290 [Amborella trichopoda]|uniref:RING-type E3 ubiquitin transferase n=1 Tax=Amborella trichopoda TaxID=13333 RepID=U5DI02_AMBTC|nr:ERAD-associated E3 ubiquitin-protein ligase HRD1B [Amborella trichopoda]ERN20188.1 hypothetical protein AMTR_s00066p00113660 [Amborella trichopoda]|eukprot:XP_006858721.1 ERAD-associated E3 ubiquitin-protein ligase HRD1B [Amborella trichopoda]